MQAANVHTLVSDLGIVGKTIARKIAHISIDAVCVHGFVYSVYILYALYSTHNSMLTVWQQRRILILIMFDEDQS